MYPDFLASPELALDCLRQEHHIRHREAEHDRLTRHSMASRPSSLTALWRAVKTIRSWCYLRLKPKPKLTSIPASSR